MSANTAEDAHELFVKVFNAGDLEGLLALYEPDAMLIPFPREPVHDTTEYGLPLRVFLH